MLSNGIKYYLPESLTFFLEINTKGSLSVATGQLVPVFLLFSLLKKTKNAFIYVQSLHVASSLFRY